MSISKNEPTTTEGLTAQIDELEKSAKVNITKALEVREDITEMQEKASQLVDKGGMFEKSAADIERKTFWNLYRMYIIVGLVIAILVAIALKILLW